MQDINQAFVLIQDYERRSLIHAVGLPDQMIGQNAWTGVGFRLHDLDLVSPIDEVSEIMPLPDLARVPRAKKWLLGVANIRGSLMPVVDLNHYLFGQETSQSLRNRILVAKHETGGVGLLVDEVLGQRHFALDDHQPTPEGLPEEIQPLVDGGLMQNEAVWVRIHFSGLFEQVEFMQAAA